MIIINDNNIVDEIDEVDEVSVNDDIEGVVDYVNVDVDDIDDDIVMLLMLMWCWLLTFFLKIITKKYRKFNYYIFKNGHIVKIPLF